jgi:hypothetical protein
MCIQVEGAFEKFVFVTAESRANKDRLTVCFLCSPSEFKGGVKESLIEV